MSELTIALEDFDTFLPMFKLVMDKTISNEVAPKSLQAIRVKPGRDYVKLRLLADNNKLRIFTVRDSNNTLAACAVFIIDTHLNFDGLIFATPTIYYVMPEYRRKGIGSKLFAVAEQGLAALGVRAVITGGKTYLPFNAFWDKLGYEPIEVMYLKTIG